MDVSLIRRPKISNFTDLGFPDLDVVNPLWRRYQRRERTPSQVHCHEGSEAHDELTKIMEDSPDGT